MAEHKDETVLEEAKSLLVQGKRFMALEDYYSATDHLEQAVQLYDAIYGVGKRECADAYLEYGLALFALANLEATGTEKIMKKAGIEEEEEEGEDEEEEAEDEEGEAEAEDDDEEAGAEAEADTETEKADGETATNCEKVSNGADEQGAPKENEEKPEAQKNQDTDAQKAVEGESAKDVAQQDAAAKKEPSEDANGTKTNGVQHKDQPPKDQPQASSSAGPDPQPGTSGGDAEASEDGEATTIEIAWEVLCLAKRVFMMDESFEGRLNLAEALQKLGEISNEWDNFNDAVDLLTECLTIREAILRPDDRLVALTYYHLGLAYSYKSETQNANDNFEKAITVIEKRIESLNKDLEKAKESQDTVALSSYQKEINELKDLLPDMKMRIDDSKESAVKSTEVLKRTREEMQQEDEEAQKLCSDKSKPVDDISHLVKRKAT